MEPTGTTAPIPLRSGTGVAPIPLRSGTGVAPVAATQHT
jgi:hypothetical protein